MSTTKIQRRIITVPADGEYKVINQRGCGVIVSQAPVFEQYSEFPLFHFDDKGGNEIEVFPESKYGQPFEKLFIEGTAESEGTIVVLYISQDKVETDLNPFIASKKTNDRELTPGTTFNESITDATVVTLTDSQKYKGGAAGTGDAQALIITPESYPIRIAWGTDPSNATPLGNLIEAGQTERIVGFNFIDDLRIISAVPNTTAEVSFTAEFPVTL